MAGYDFSFQVNNSWKDVTLEFLNYTLNIARSLGLEAHSRTLSGNEGFYVTLDGPLQQMQVFEEDSSRASDHFVRSKFPKITLRRVKFYDQVLRPYFTANTKGLMRITDMVFRNANDFGGKPSGRVLSPEVYKLLDKRGLSARSKKAIASIIDIHHSFLLGESDESMLITVDGSVENILKDRLGVTGRLDFPPLVDMALNNGVITSYQKRRLLKLHTHRNPVQHAGKNVNKAKLRSYIALAISLIQN